MTRLLANVLLLTCAAVAVGQGSGARPTVNQKLPVMDGKQLRIVQVEVRYTPGQASPSHSHPCPVLARVLEGTIVSKVDDGPETTYKEGETFFEPPNGTHAVSRNGSDKVPARLLATFVCDSEGPLSKAPPQK